MTTLNSTDYKQPIYVTAAYILLWYIFLYLQAFGKMYLFAQHKKKAAKDAKDGKEVIKKSFADIKYKATDKIAILLDRTVGNMIEQGIPFLVTIWLNAIFVSPTGAATIGAIYIGFRIIYPVVFYYGLPWILISTIPGYACISILLIQCVQKAYYS